MPELVPHRNTTPGTIGYHDHAGHFRCPACMSDHEFRTVGLYCMPLWYALTMRDPYDYRPCCSRCDEPLPVALTPEGTIYEANQLDPDALILLTEDDEETSRNTLEQIVQDMIRDYPDARPAIRDLLAPEPYREYPQFAMPEPASPAEVAYVASFNADEPEEV